MRLPIVFRSTGGDAADADRAGVAGARNHLDTGAQSAGEREGGAWIFDGPGPVGEGNASGRSNDVRASQPLPGNRVLPWVNDTLAVTPANPDDAHRPLEKQHDLAAILSHVESRQVNNDYTIQLDTKIYQIARQDICTGLRGAVVRVEKRRDGSVAVRFRDRYLRIATGDGAALDVRAITDLRGHPIEVGRLEIQFGLGLTLPALETLEQLTALDSILCRSESFWSERLAILRPIAAPLSHAVSAADGSARYIRRHLRLPASLTRTSEE